MDVRRIVAPLIGVLLLLGIAGGVWYSKHRVIASNSDAPLIATASDSRSLNGMIGSEKEAYFSDPRVQAIFAKNGLHVTIEKVGSRSIATQYDAKKYDFGFPSGASAALKLKQVSKAKNTYTPFYTPMVIASWRPIADLLVANKVATLEHGFYWVDMQKLLSLSEQKSRWSDLPNNTSFATNKAILIASTDVRSSNSAAMYLALASYVLNNNTVLQSQAELDALLPQVSPLFLRQGFQESSSLEPFQDYLALGMGKTPLLMAYESQMLAFWLQHPERKKDNMVLLYPKPTIFSKHVFVPFNAKGEQLGALLEKDAELQNIAHEYGFRTASDDAAHWKKQGVQIPDDFVDVIDPPSQEWLERMIQQIDQQIAP
jgi:hypothetical protein